MNAPGAIATHCEHPQTTLSRRMTVLSFLYIKVLPERPTRKRQHPFRSDV